MATFTSGEKTQDSCKIYRSWLSTTANIWDILLLYCFHLRIHLKNVHTVVYIHIILTDRLVNKNYYKIIYKNYVPPL